jgi:GWxTD domain-containing protein
VNFKLKYFLFLLLFFAGKLSFSVEVYYKLASFYIPKQDPFVETYMTIAGQSVKRMAVQGGYQSAVNINFLIVDANGKIVKGNKYNLKGPVYSDTTNVPAFIDNQRYSLPSGSYTIELTVNDVNSNQPPFKLIQTIKLNYNAYPIQASSIQILESFKKTTAPNPLSKSGFDLIPYNIDYYPETVNKIQFYFESYNTDTFLGKSNPFIYKYFIENTDDLKPVGDFSAFKKAVTAPVNPLIGQFDISKLQSGNYNLVIEVRDEKNIIQLQEKYFFQRRNKSVDPVYATAFDVPNALEKYFRNVKSVDTLKIFVECLWPISDMKERERQINQTIKKDTALMRNYLIDYWTKRAADSVSPMKIWMEYLKSVNEVEVLFKCGKQKGYFTDRGRVYLQYGKPNQRAVQPNEPSTFPYEIWQYYRLNDKSNGQFFSNRKFVFVNKSVADDCFKLEHSDMRGEIFNERWRYEVMKRQTDGIHDPDNTSPNTGNTQLNDLFTSPR